MKIDCKKIGISLIVLVITIVVMLIIAGAIIITLNNTNVIYQAEYARERHNITILEENLRLERQNILLEKHGSVKDSDVSVKEILGLTDEDVIEIATSNSIPANMPSGKYYELDGDRYATRIRENERKIILASREIDRDNKILTDTYVVNEKLDVYYVISGTIKESEPEIDDEKVSGIIASVMMGTKDEIEGINELKTELHIEENISSIDDLMMVFYDPIEREQFCMYFKTVDRIYILEVSEIDEELIIEAEYASKESNQLLYQYASKLGDIHTELEIAFLGKTTIEIKEKYDNNLLKQYILENCSSLKTIELEEYEVGDTRIIQSAAFEYGNNTDEEFCEYNSIYFITDENGVYTKIKIESGT